MSALLPLRHFCGWLATGERGISSEAIVTHLTGIPVGQWGGSDHPHDPSDFRRCQLLLNHVPLARLAFSEMRSKSPEWDRLVDAWDDIHAMSESEVPGYLEGRNGEAPKTYRLMRRVIDGGTTCASCEGTGQAEACPKCKGTGRRCGGRCRADGCARGYRYCRDCRGRGYTGGVR